MLQQSRALFYIYNKAIVLKKHLSVAVLLTLLPLSYTVANSDWNNDPSGKTKVAIYCGFGVPSGGDKTYTHYNWTTGKPEGQVGIEPNIGLGLVLGYDFLFDASYKVGPEIGLLYGFTRRIKIPPSYPYYKEYTIEERYLEIPIALLYGRAYYDDDTYSSLGYSLGCQLDVLLSSHCITAFDKTDMKEMTPGLSKIRRNLLLAGHLALGAFCLELKLKLPEGTLRKISGRQSFAIHA
jgi:hypothetical protein